MGFLWVGDGVGVDVGGLGFGVMGGIIGCLARVGGDFDVGVGDFVGVGCVMVAMLKVCVKSFEKFFTWKAYLVAMKTPTTVQMVYVGLYRQ
jgi:hypothetical protein